MAESEYFKQLPKVELHAHLNGSLTGKTLEKLGCSESAIAEYEKLTRTAPTSRSLQECFGLFSQAYNVIKSPESVYVATRNVIEDFAKDNVIYLELRTTPRANVGMTKEDYIEAVVKAIVNHEYRNKILVKLILSLDRRHSKEESEKALELILRMREKYPSVIKGIDLCGNPEEGDFHETIFEKAKQFLGITIHCAEVKNDSEVERILMFGPNRIGHGTYLHPEHGGSQKNWELYLEKKIPLECCLTSNIICGTTKSYQDHHVRHWLDLKLPFSICTDDKGVFGTTLTKEYTLVQRHFDKIPENLWKMTYDSISHSFASEREKQDLQDQLIRWFNVCHPKIVSTIQNAYNNYTPADLDILLEEHQRDVYINDI
nr:adenosine deaminase-like protein [Leptinotarsa decemlineata]